MAYIALEEHPDIAAHSVKKAGEYAVRSAQADCIE